MDLASSSESRLPRTPSPFLFESDLPAILEKLKSVAREAHPSRIPYPNDHSEHYKIFSRAISNVLSTELAVFTFGQIIDGLPTADVAWDCQFPDIVGDHPVEEHQDVCPGVLDRARSFRDEFDASILTFDPKALHSFQNAPLHSWLFNIQLIELVAVAMHEIGTLLFQLGFRMHKGDIKSIDQWTEIPPRGLWEVTPPMPTMLYHHGYLIHDVYPNGVADMVGYWAENRILGGVVRAPDFPSNVYFHSCRYRVTRRYYQLRGDQQQTLLDFLLAENLGAEQTNCPLHPILADKTNTVRVNEEDALLLHLYRDIWERKPPTRGYIRMAARMCRTTIDYPEQEAFINYINANFDTVTITVPPRQHDSANSLPGGGEADEGRGGEKPL